MLLSPSLRVFVHQEPTQGRHEVCLAEKKDLNGKFNLSMYCTETRKNVCTRLREFSSCSCVTTMLGTALFLHSPTYKPFFSPLYYPIATWGKICFRITIFPVPLARWITLLVKRWGRKCDRGRFDFWSGRPPPNTFISGIRETAANTILSATVQACHLRKEGADNQTVSKKPPLNFFGTCNSQKDSNPKSLITF